MTAGQYSRRARVSNQSEELVEEQRVSGSPPDDRIAPRNLLAEFSTPLWEGLKGLKLPKAENVQ